MTHHPTACCQYTCPIEIPHPVQWNPYNQVVQCHNCGHVYEPVRVIADDASHKRALDDLVAMIEEYEKRAHPPHLGDGA